MAPVHAEQVPTVVSVGRVCSNRLSRTPAKLSRTHLLLLLTKSISFSVNHTTGKASTSSQPRSLFKIKWGKDREGGGGGESWRWGSPGLQGGAIYVAVIKNTDSKSQSRAPHLTCMGYFQHDEFYLFCSETVLFCPSWGTRANPLTAPEPFTRPNCSKDSPTSCPAGTHHITGPSGGWVVGMDGNRGQDTQLPLSATSEMSNLV